MAMSRRDYVEIAKVIRQQVDDFDLVDENQAMAIATVARGLADHFKRTNPAFRYDMFFEACGLDGFGYVK